MIFLASCKSNLESDDGGVDTESTYNMAIDGLGIYEGTETAWGFGTGIVVLGPEETGEPLARLEFDVRQGTVNSDSVYINRAILSWSNVRSGEPSEIDARLYVLNAPVTQCTILAINETNIELSGRSGRCGLPMRRIDQNGSGEVIAVSFTANAVDR